MAITNLPIFAAMRSKMEWHQTRQSLLAENVANAETPGYQGRDLQSFEFAEMVRASNVSSVSTRATHSNHFSISNTNDVGFGGTAMTSFEVTPEGNAVELEEEMMKVAENQMDYQAVTSLYTRSLRLLKTAFGR